LYNKIPHTGSLRKLLCKQTDWEDFLSRWFGAKLDMKCANILQTYTSTQVYTEPIPEIDMYL